MSQTFSVGGVGYPFPDQGDSPPWGQSVVDWASAVTNQLLTPVGQVKFADGTAGAPSISFSSDPDSGFLRPGADRIDVSLGGVSRVQFQTTGIGVSIPSAEALNISTAFAGGILSGNIINTSESASSDARLYVRVGAATSGDPFIGFAIVSGTTPDWSIGVDNSDSDKFKLSASSVLGSSDVITVDSAGTTTFTEAIREKNGSVASPGYTFTNDIDTGIYSGGANVLSFAAGGALTFFIDTSGSFSRFPFYAPNGTIALPSFSFENDTNTGIYRPAVDTMDFICGGSNAIECDNSVTANNTRLLVHDVTAAALRRVTIGAADSGGAGFRVLRIPN